MKIVTTIILMCTLFILFAGSGQADSLIRGGQWADAAPVVAYNSRNQEYLVVWSEFLTMLPFYGPVMGRILDKNGQKISPSFQILDSGVKPAVVYDPDRNEYCVVCESNFTTYVQFITDRGMPADGGFFKSNSTFPRVLYNTLAQNFLLVFLSIQENPAGSSNCDHALVAVSFDRNQFSPEHQILNLYNNACADGEYFAVAFAPIDTPLTPKGRYLVGVDNVNFPLYMLNKDGERVLVKPGTGGVGYQIDFDSEAISPVNMDISFGYRNNDPQLPVFLVVWGEKGNRIYDGFQWTGIYGGVVEANLDDYSGEVNNFTFPISLQWFHDTSSAETWNPKSGYDRATGKFMVIWREVPTTPADPRDLAQHNHIRGNTIRRDLGPYGAENNFLISSDIETADPGLPALAAADPHPLVVWQDNRNHGTELSDIYGTLIDTAHKTTVELGTFSSKGEGQKWRSVSAGWEYSLGIRTDGTLWAWGRNNEGQLGVGDPYTRYTPTQVGTETNWVVVTAGIMHTLGIRSDGTLWAWGGGPTGELGLGNGAYKDRPSRVGQEKDWVAVRAGEYDSLGIRSDRTLWAWGWNLFGQLGVGDHYDRYTPTRVGTETNWVAVKTEVSHTLGIRSDGTLWAWGINYHGQLGLNDNSDRNTPTKVGTDNWPAVDAGLSHSLGIQSNGSLWAWGSNDYGALGSPDVYDRLSPELIDASHWLKVHAGDETSLGIQANHSLWAWGKNWHGQLGLGDNTERYLPEQVTNWNDWMTVDLGHDHTLGIRADGTLWAWGGNWYGQLGLGDQRDRNVPTRVGKEFFWPMFLPAIISGRTN